MKDGEFLPEKPRKYRPYNKQHSYCLEINDADEYDEGEYSVIIKGKKSSATLSVEVGACSRRLTVLTAIVYFIGGTIHLHLSYRLSVTHPYKL